MTPNSNVVYWNQSYEVFSGGSETMQTNLDILNMGAIKKSPHFFGVEYNITAKSRIGVAGRGCSGCMCTPKLLVI